MPYSYTAKELRRLKFKGVLTAACIAVGFCLSASGVVFATKGIDITLNFAKDVLADLGVI